MDMLETPRGRWVRWLWTGVFVLGFACAGYGAATRINWHEIGPHATPFGVLAVILLLASCCFCRFRVPLVEIHFFLFLVVTSWFVPIATLGAAFLFFLAATLLGLRFTRDVGVGRFFCALLVGTFLIAASVGWLLPYRVHTAPVYTAVLALILWLNRKEMPELRAAATRWLLAQRKGPRFPMVLALTVCFVSLTTVWQPTIQYDELAYHSMLSFQLRELAHFRFDLASQVWGAAPWGSDVVQAIIGVLADDDGRNAANIAWFLVSCAALWAIGDVLGLTVTNRWLSIALFASQPFVSGLLGTAQAENEVTAVTLGMLFLLLKSRDPGARVWCCFLLLCGLMATLKASQALVALPFLLALLPSLRREFRGRLVILALVVCGLFASSYLYAAFLTGNPFLPLANGVFGSPYFPLRNFIDPRWLSELSWHAVWDVSFDTNRFQESRAGGAGVSLFFLSSFALFGLYFRKTRVPMLVLLVAGTLMFGLVQYFRYIAPLVIAMIPLCLFVGQQVLTPRVASLGIGLLAVTNVVLLPATSHTLRDDTLKNQLSFVRKFRPDIHEGIANAYAFEVEAAAVLKARAGPAYSVYLADPERPYLAPFAGRAFTGVWYDPTMKAASEAADADASGASWRRLFAQTGIDFVLVTRSQTVSPALAEALKKASVDFETSKYMLYRFSLPVDAVSPGALYKARDLSAWLRLL